MYPVRVFLIILGAVAMLLGFGCAVSGFGTYRAVDSDGYISSGPGELSTATYALVSRTIELEDRSSDPGFREGKVRIRIRAERADGGEVFIGIGREDAVGAFLLGSTYARLTGIEFDPLSYDENIVPGSQPAPAPGGSSAWLASVSGPGEQELDWRVRGGQHAFVVMNADASRGVTVRADLAVKLPYVRGFGIAFMVIGTLVFLVGILLVVLPLRSRRSPAPAGPPRDGEDDAPV